jgi:hypothetical protein
MWNQISILCGHRTILIYFLELKPEAFDTSKELPNTSLNLEPLTFISLVTY